MCDQHGDGLIVNLADDAVISDAVFPESTKRPSQSFAYAARIVDRGNPAGEKIKYPLLNLAVEFLQITERIR
jgi:hypothetical protein